MPEHQQIQQSKKTNTIFQKQATSVIQKPLSNPNSIIQRAKINPKSLTHADVMQLQRTIGNRAVAQLLAGTVNSSTAHEASTQRSEIPEEEEPLQGKFENKPEIACPSCFAAPIARRQEVPEEEPLHGKMAETVQCHEIPEEEETLQTKRENNTGMPDNLKAGVENLSGIDMSDVRVHYNSLKPAEVGALAYTQGTAIHVAPGQERHLPHEAWHVVQQKQGRVCPTLQTREGFSVNNDAGLEKEADTMGEKTVNMNEIDNPSIRLIAPDGQNTVQYRQVIQLYWFRVPDSKNIIWIDGDPDSESMEDSKEIHHDQNKEHPDGPIWQLIEKKAEQSTNVTATMHGEMSLNDTVFEDSDFEDLLSVKDSRPEADEMPALEGLTKYWEVEDFRRFGLSEPVTAVRTNHPNGRDITHKVFWCKVGGVDVKVHLVPGGYKLIYGADDRDNPGEPKEDITKENLTGQDLYKEFLRIAKISGPYAEGRNDCVAFADNMCRALSKAVGTSELDNFM